MNNSEWLVRAACAGADTDLFYAPDQESADRRVAGGQGLTERHIKALAYCARCPVMAECREWALTHHERGVWGGLTEHARKRITTGERKQVQHARTAVPERIAS